MNAGEVGLNPSHLPKVLKKMRYLYKVFFEWLDGKVGPQHPLLYFLGVLVFLGLIAWYVSWEKLKE
jgi:hypothetical protein